MFYRTTEKVTGNACYGAYQGTTSIGSARMMTFVEAEYSRKNNIMTPLLLVPSVTRPNSSPDHKCLRVRSPGKKTECFTGRTDNLHGPPVISMSNSSTRP